MTANGGTLGTAPGCSLYAVKVLGDRGIGSTASLIAGLEWAVDNRMHIVHMSVGTVRTSRSLRKLASRRTEQAACSSRPQAMAAADAVTVIPYWPCPFPLGACGRCHRPSQSACPVSPQPGHPSVWSPRRRIPCAVPGGFQHQTGTSAAAAHVSGIAALLIEACSPTHRQLRRALGLSAHPCGPRAPVRTRQS